MGVRGARAPVRGGRAAANPILCGRAMAGQKGRAGLLRGRAAEGGGCEAGGGRDAGAKLVLDCLACEVWLCEVRWVGCA